MPVNMSISYRMDRCWCNYKMQFDLISDLHVEQWAANQQMDWSGLGTSLIAVVAGDVSRDLDLTYRTVVDISKHYRHVIYVDGNHEHDGRRGINERRVEIRDRFSKYRNITYLFRETVILDNTAFIGSNGWYSYNFCEPMMSKQECVHNLVHHKNKSQDLIFEQWEMAMEDADFIRNTVNICSTDVTVKDIVLITHTVPNRQLAWIPDNDEIYLMGEQGSTYLEDVLRADVNDKVKAWCFGHLHSSQDQLINGIRYVSNPRGIPTHKTAKHIYYPQLIKC